MDRLTRAVQSALEMHIGIVLVLVSAFRAGPGMTAQPQGFYVTLPASPVAVLGSPSAPPATMASHFSSTLVSLVIAPVRPVQTFPSMTAPTASLDGIWTRLGLVRRVISPAWIV
jgi:hypothetical protein